MIDTNKLISLGINLVPTYKGLRNPQLPNWPDMATTDPTKVAEWAEKFPDYNYCCIAKNDATCIVDIDDLAACKAAGLPPVPKTFTVKSPKGYHLHFKQSAETVAMGNRNVKVGDAKVFELKVHNQACAAPGCVREDGKEYVISRDLPLVEMDAEFAEWIRVNSQSKRTGGTLRKVHDDFEAEELFRHYEWEYASEFVKDGAIYYVFAECPIAEHQHKDQIRSKKCCLIIGKTVGFNCVSCGEEYTYSDLINKMTEDGYEEFPGYIFADEDDSLLLADVDDCGGEAILSVEEAVKLFGPNVTIDTPLPEYDTTGFTYQHNDTGNSERLAKKYGNIIRYCQGRWYVWNGKRWQLDHYQKLDRMAKWVSKDILAEAEGISDEKKNAAWLRWGIASGERSRRSNMIELASSLKGILKLPTDFDVNLWDFNVANGTIDLRTGTLRPHNPGDNITKMSPVVFDPSATCPTWDNFMHQAMMGRDSLVEFLARITGWSLTGDTRQQTMFFNYGGGENGKGVFTETVAYISGEYSYTASFDTFAYHDKKNRDIRSDLAELVGVRFLNTEESSEGHRLDEALIKQLTGENTITTRHLYQREFSYKPTFKIFMSSNFRPSIKSMDWGTWRRVKMIPWEFTVPKEHRDEQLKSKLRAEASGILNWMLRGLAEIVANDYKISYPAEVEVATAQYKNSQDIIAQFLEAQCDVSPGVGRTKSSALYSAFKMWAEASRERNSLTQRSFTEEILRRDAIYKDLDREGTWMVGVSIKQSASSRAMDEMADLI